MPAQPPPAPEDRCALPLGDAVRTADEARASCPRPAATPFPTAVPWGAVSAMPSGPPATVLSVRRILPHHARLGHYSSPGPQALTDPLRDALQHRVAGAQLALVELPGG